MAGALLLGAPRAATAAEGLQGDVDQAATIMARFRDLPESAIPEAVIRKARGLAIMTVLKAGFLVSARGGRGLVIARVGNGWSPPSAIGTGGAGFGFQAGAQVTEFVMVLNTDEAVKAFSRGGNVSLGADVSVAAGPVGRTLEAAVTPIAAIYTYSRSQGLFAGVSAEGTVVATRDEANAAYYGRSVTPDQILSGKVASPAGTKVLITELQKF
jgi:lipid-binding SYLF domain-containing protein